MKLRQIDLFFMRAYVLYCNDKITYNELEKQLDFDGFVNQHKVYLVKKYVEDRRARRA